ncbi:MAG: 23S ribosomal RNA methyltransferase Erm [Mobilicoccus sp.]|nr:23S ribosomal RNA methyltransferase Erm [Mobilicoccus sp.]
MPTYSRGRHEHGQNFLTDPRTIEAILCLVQSTDGPLIEIGPGDGALTTGLARMDRPLTVIEIDADLAALLRRRLPAQVRVEHADFLDHRLPNHPHVLVSNLPFHQTTAMLRRILHAPHWTDAVLLVQWEVARRRAGVGGSSMMTAQWAPWITFGLHSRVPARAFTPRPGVDGGILTMRRDPHPALPVRQRRAFQVLVHRVYTGPGRGLAQILSRTTGIGTPAAAQTWLAGHGLAAHDLPRSLPTDAWIDLYRTTGSSPPRRRR